ncbi:hypothetical protein, variant [Sphaeroforma arctica JP610]|uniref:Uncharacterized protein n=1 Tax=Sphaeroforma arctica JP610 TaxID=667725 RepID=A0A0L0G927_9EUKA|nr:hypothetical protein, variant [Sphaeroforma arctica JP610]KNC85505.1 hypothetical protein, variant [Sphaeroforma arctica JP610]|eukprot:XP_014159407.1 hypothetical protein, variant [Sphaeroforma arctica JP610]
MADLCCASYTSVSGLLLGSRCDAEQRVAIATAGTELCDRVNEVIGQMGGHRHSERTNSAEGAHSINRTAPAKNRAAKLQLCEILVDSHGLLSEIEITQALQYIVHGRAGGATFDADQSESSFKKRSCSTEAFNWKAASTPNQKALNLSSADLAGEEINGCVFSTESVCDDDIEMVRENIETTLYPQLPLSGAQVDCSCTEQGPKPKINGTRCTRNTKLEANREPEEGDGPVHAKPAQTSGSRQLSGRRQTGEPAANTLAGEVRRVENASTSPEPSSDSGQISRTAGEPLLERSNGDALITELRAFLQHVCDKAGVVVMATDRVAGRDPSTPPSNDSRASVQRRTVKPYTHTRNPTTLPPTHTPTPPPMAVRTSTRTRTRTSTLERAFRDSAEGMGGPQSVERDHVILMLDKSVQHLPWECLPLLSNQAVSRMPCAESIVSALASADETATGSDEAPTDPRLTVDVADTYYVLNPEGDLQNTEKTFANDFQR